MAELAGGSTGSRMTLNEPECQAAHPVAASIGKREHTC